MRRIFAIGTAALMANARESQWLALAEQHPQLQLSVKIHEPAQAANALAVGAFTERVDLGGTREGNLRPGRGARRCGVLLPLFGIALALAMAMQDLLVLVRAAIEGRGAHASALFGGTPAARNRVAT